MMKQRALTATVWSGIDIFLRQGLQLVLTITLAHLLTPTDFGIFALLALFTGIATVFADGGFSAALIQRQDIERIDESTVFWINLVAALAAALVLCASAPMIARFYSQPILVPLAMALAGSVFLGALGTIHTTLLTKRLEFRRQLQAGGSGVVASAIVAIWMAWHDYGVWSLAAQSIVMTAVTTAMLWLRSGWRPQWAFSAVSARRLFAFGGYHFAYGLLEILYARMYTLLIGKFYGPQQLGYYNNADTTRQIPGSFIASALSRVVFPMFAEAATDTQRLYRGMQFATRGMMLFNAPIMLGMAATADPLVRVLFGTQWLPAVPILRVLCLAGVLWPLLALNPYVLLAQNRSRLMFWIEVVKKSIGILLLGLGSWYGLIGVAWAVFAFSLIAFAINAHYARTCIGYGLGSQLRDLAPIVLVAMVMASVVYMVSMYWQAAPAIELVGLGALGAALFVAGAWLIGLHALHDVVSVIRHNPGQTPPGSTVA
jgi:O-antigen/teichoic acid export membrane protein